RRRLGVGRWVFWGSSAGGCIGLLYALQYPRALSGLIVAHMGPSGRRIVSDPRSVVHPRHPRNEPDLARLGSALERHATIPGADGALGPSAEWVHLRDDHDLQWVLTQHGAPLMMWDGDPRRQASIEEFLSRFDVGERLGEIQIPTLVVAGRRDEWVP